MTTALQSVQKLIDHIESVELAKRRNNNASIEPSAEDKSERDRLMNAILQSLGLTRDELLSKLGADRTSWDRWRYLASKPHRSYLDAMKRFAAETDREEIVDETLPKPLVMLASRPCNWAKLRLVFSLYNCWRNAIFKFSEPYSDIDVIIEMALLSLRGCKIVFIIPEEKINVWGCTFIAGLKSKLNKVVAARVLSRICVIKSNVSTNNDAQ